MTQWVKSRHCCFFHPACGLTPFLRVCFLPQWDFVCTYWGGEEWKLSLEWQEGQYEKRRETKVRREGRLTVPFILHFLDFASMFTLHSVCLQEQVLQIQQPRHENWNYSPLEKDTFVIG